MERILRDFEPMNDWLRSTLEPAEPGPAIPASQADLEAPGREQDLYFQKGKNDMPIMIEYRAGREKEPCADLESAVATCFQRFAYDAPEDEKFRPGAIVADGRRIEGEALRSMVREHARKAGLPSPV